MGKLKLAGDYDVKLARVLSFLVSVQVSNLNEKKTRLFVSGRSPECSDCLLMFKEQ